MCVCECCIPGKIIHSSLLSWHERYLKNLKYQFCNSQNRRSVEMANRISNTNKLLSCHMVSICLKQHLTWIWQNFVHIHHQNMHYHIGNECCVVVHVFISQFQNEISTIQVLVLQYVFMFIN